MPRRHLVLLSDGEPCRLCGALEILINEFESSTGGPDVDEVEGMLARLRDLPDGEPTKN